MTSVRRRRVSRPVTSTRASWVSAAPPGGSGSSLPSRKRAPSAEAMPVPPSVVALPPMQSTRRSTSASRAAATSSPVPRVLAQRGSALPPGSNARPEAAASSTNAVRGTELSGLSANGASTGRPVGPETVRSWPVHPAARTTTTEPSPPSATGRSRASRVTPATVAASRRPASTATAASCAGRLPLNESGATTTVSRADAVTPVPSATWMFAFCFAATLGAPGIPVKRHLPERPLNVAVAAPGGAGPRSCVISR